MPMSQSAYFILLWSFNTTELNHDIQIWLLLNFRLRCLLTESLSQHLKSRHFKWANVFQTNQSSSVTEISMFRFRKSHQHAGKWWSGNLKFQINFTNDKVWKRDWNVDEALNFHFTTEDWVCMNKRITWKFRQIILMFLEKVKLCNYEQRRKCKQVVQLWAEKEM